jgi:diaminohydroxyphosphoribosylaminopyrimidine deaminase / 5-amino-6-(5-phosphoribosylamino)uracil reductase
MSKTANVVTDDAAETIIFTLDSTELETAFFEHPLVSIEWISENVSFLSEVLKRLANKVIMTLFIEGGSKVHSSINNSGLTDELYLYMAPKLIGNGASLFMDGTRNLIAEGESLRFLDVR